jgi:hypothetical protein
MAMAYDPDRKVVVMYGGSPGGVTDNIGNLVAARGDAADLGVGWCALARAPPEA